MTVTPRVLLTLLAALWLPVCHCQFSTFLQERSSCCEASAEEAAHDEDTDCCGKPINSPSQDNHGDSNKNTSSPFQSCHCCVAKAPPPVPVSIDLNTAECILPPSIIGVAEARPANEISSLSLRKHDPPGPPLGVNERCAMNSTWLI